MASRVLAALAGGYALAALASVALSLGLPPLAGTARSEAVLAGTLWSFVVYVVAVIWAFVARTAWRAWAGLLLAALPAAAGAAMPETAPETDAARVAAPVAGTLTLWQAEDGAAVEAGQVIAVIEAMKMETRVEAHRAGKLTRIAAQGATLGFDAPLARID